MNLFAKICSFLSFFCVGNTAPFDYDLHLFSIPGTNSRTMICFHGYGANYQIAEQLKELQLINATLISFNFPDHDLQEKTYDPHKIAFGTIQELLPAFYVLKKHVIDQGLDTIDLYGFSAGGGAVINVIATLNTSTYDGELAKIGIADKEKKRLLKAIQKGLVILDAPLKSVDEIIDLRGSSIEFEMIAKNYHRNHLRPIDSLELLRGLSLNIILYFQEPDEIIFNRDDAIYIERLKRANARGTTSLVIADDGGHLAPHFSLWQAYSKKISERQKQ